MVNVVDLAEADTTRAGRGEHGSGGGTGSACQWRWRWLLSSSGGEDHYESRPPTQVSSSLLHKRWQSSRPSSLVQSITSTRQEWVSRRQATGCIQWYPLPCCCCCCCWCSLAATGPVAKQDLSAAQKRLQAITAQATAARAAELIARATLYYCCAAAAAAGPPGEDEEDVGKAPNGFMGRQYAISAKM